MQIWLTSSAGFQPACRFYLLVFFMQAGSLRYLSPLFPQAGGQSLPVLNRCVARKARTNAETHCYASVQSVPPEKFLIPFE